MMCVIERVHSRLGTGTETELKGFSNDDAGATEGRRLVAVWDGKSFVFAVAPEDLQPGQFVVLRVRPVRDTCELAGRFRSFVGTLTDEEAAEMQGAIEGAFNTISDER